MEFWHLKLASCQAEVRTREVPKLVALVIWSCAQWARVAKLSPLYRAKKKDEKEEEKMRHETTLA